MIGRVSRIDLGGNMLPYPKISVWGALNFEKSPKMGFRNVADMYSKACKNQTNGDRDLKYGLK